MPCPSSVSISVLGGGRVYLRLGTIRVNMWPLRSCPADAFPRIAPIRAAESLHSQPPQHLQCPLYRPDSSSFAASLRELEKVGGAWGLTACLLSHSPNSKPGSPFIFFRGRVVSLLLYLQWQNNMLLSLVLWDVVKLNLKKTSEPGEKGYGEIFT